MVHDSFSAWIKAQVQPLRQSHPTWHRLDGQDAGGNRQVFVRFRHAGRVWAVHGDTRFRPVLAAYQAMRDGGVSDPFDIKQTKSGQCLTLKPEIWNRDLPKHFYAYRLTP